MGRKKLSNVEKARRYFAAHPNATPRQAAEATGIPIHTVYSAKYKSKQATGVKVSKKPGVNIDAVYKAKPHEDVTPLAHDPRFDFHPKAERVDMVNQPPHYKDGGIETIDFLQAKLTREEFIGYLKGNVLKYGSRLGKKDALDVDAGKMAWYAVKLRDMLNART